MCAMFNNSLANSLFGSRNSIWSGSFLSASNLGDLGLMKSGVYTKMLKSYYEKVGNDKDTKTESSSSSSTSSSNTSSTWDDVRKRYITPEVTVDPKAVEAEKALSNIKSASQNLSKDASALANMDFDGSSRDEIYDAVKKMADSYNAVVDGAKKSSLPSSITKSVSWMIDDTKSNTKQLERMGITIGEDNKIKIDKDKFAQANFSDIKDFFGGTGSFADRNAQRANGFVKSASNQMMMNIGKSFYSSSGVLS